GGQVHRRRGLAGAALLIEDGDAPRPSLTGERRVAERRAPAVERAEVAPLSVANRELKRELRRKLASADRTADGQRRHDSINARSTASAIFWRRNQSRLGGGVLFRAGCCRSTI